MTYLVKEIFLTLQGEGRNTGAPAVFCRFSGCNLWTGHERHRSIAICQFCDTQFVGTDGVGGGKFPSADELAQAVEAAWVGGDAERLVVCTGGEPLLQLDEEAVEAFHRRGFRVAVETNGTVAAPVGLDWICVSPKAGTEILITAGNELKLVYPQAGIEPEDVEHLAFDHFYLSPMDDPNRSANTVRAVEYCLLHPTWRLSLQTHKYIGIA